VESIDMIESARKVTSIIPGGKDEFINAREDDRHYRVSSENIRRLPGFERGYSVDGGIALPAGRVRANRPERRDPASHSHMYRRCERAGDSAGPAARRVKAKTIAPWGSGPDCLPGQESRTRHERRLNGAGGYR
jgi:hypothetical protein